MHKYFTLYKLAPVRQHRLTLKEHVCVCVCVRVCVSMQMAELENENV